MQEAEDAGEPVTQTWLLTEARYEALLEQIRAGGELAGTKAATATGTAQAGAVETAAAAAARWTAKSVGVGTVKQLAQVTGISWNALPADALKAVVGLAGDGSPLLDLFRSVSSDRADQVRDTLLAGIGRGASAREIATELQQISDVSAARARTIARTEVNRAARSATIDSYAQNPTLVSGWVWLSSADLRTCPACWAMHGTEHPLSEEFGSHPACRCCACPSLVDIRSSADQPDVRPKFEAGADKFADLDEADQKTILGPKMYGEFAAGRVSLADTVHITADPRWGITRTAASVSQALQSAASRF